MFNRIHHNRRLLSDIRQCSESVIIYPLASFLVCHSVRRHERLDKFLVVVNHAAFIGVANDRGVEVNGVKEYGFFEAELAKELPDFARYLGGGVMMFVVSAIFFILSRTNVLKMLTL